MNTGINAPTRLVVGCMTGTSLDGIDLALVEIHGQGLGLTARLRRTLSASFDDPTGFGTILRRAAGQSLLNAGELAEMARQFGVFHVEYIEKLLDGSRVDLVCAHGQTVFHKPPSSWQLLNPAPIADRLRAPVVFDLRAADLAAGGQGAPITPIADLVMFGDLEESRVIVNLGGFCNITVLPAGARPAVLDMVDGFDLCACNHVLDQVARSVLGTSYDDGGRAALAGASDVLAVSDLVSRLGAQRSAGRSLGTGDEVGSWIAAHRDRTTPNDLAASACAALGRVIGGTIDAAVGDNARVILAGGGVRNSALLAAIKSSCGGAVDLSDAMGVPAAYREAMAMAVLGALCQDRVPVTLPRVTRCRRPAPVAGVWVLP